MARKKSLWSELQQARERRERIAQAQHSANERTVRQLIQDHERAERQATRADAAARKRQEQRAHEAGASAAEAMKARLDRRLADLRTLLTSALEAPPQLSFAMLKSPWPYRSLSQATSACRYPLQCGRTSRRRRPAC